MQDFCPIMWSPDPCLNSSGPLTHIFELRTPNRPTQESVHAPRWHTPRVSWRGLSAVSWAEWFIALWPLAFQLWTDEVLGYLTLGESTWIGYHITFLMDGLQNAQALDWVETAELFFLFRNLKVLDRMLSFHSLNCHFQIIPCCSLPLERWLMSMDTQSRTSLNSSPHQELAMMPHGLWIPLHCVLEESPLKLSVLKKESDVIYPCGVWIDLHVTRLFNITFRTWASCQVLSCSV